MSQFYVGFKIPQDGPHFGGYFFVETYKKTCVPLQQASDVTWVLIIDDVGRNPPVNGAVRAFGGEGEWELGGGVCTFAGAPFFYGKPIACGLGVGLRKRYEVCGGKTQGRNGRTKLVPQHVLFLVGADEGFFYLIIVAGAGRGFVEFVFQFVYFFPQQFHFGRRVTWVHKLVIVVVNRFLNGVVAFNGWGDLGIAAECGVVHGAGGFGKGFDGTNNTMAVAVGGGVNYLMAVDGRGCEGTGKATHKVVGDLFVVGFGKVFFVVLYNGTDALVALVRVLQVKVEGQGTQIWSPLVFFKYNTKKGKSQNLRFGAQGGQPGRWQSQTALTPRNHSPPRACTFWAYSRPDCTSSGRPPDLPALATVQL